MTRRPFRASRTLKVKIDQPSNVNEWTLYNLKRSPAIQMSRLGVAPNIIERILDHESGGFRGMAGVYNRFHYLPEMREALERWAKRIEECIGA